MYRRQRCFVVGMQGIRLLVVAPCTIARLPGVASAMPARALAAMDASLADLSRDELATPGKGRSHAEFGAAAGRSEMPRRLLVEPAWGR